MKISDPTTGFRLPRAMLATVDSICVQQDLTRSQVFRRSLMEYLKSQNGVAADVTSREPQRSWPGELFGHQH
jgi:Ribbon-helix-helix protein, copG family